MKNKGNKMTKQIIEIEIVSDTQELLEGNDDVSCASEEVEAKISSLDPSTLVKVVKTIDFPTIIHSVEEVTSDVIKEL